MAQSARFWTFRAGTPVYSPLGHLIGHVAAVRPEAVLVVTDSGKERWFPASEIAGYGQDGLTVTVTPEEAWSPSPTSPTRPGDRLDSAPRAIPSLSDDRFDA
jgi:hypothetical protein